MIAPEHPDVARAQRRHPRCAPTSSAPRGSATTSSSARTRIARRPGWRSAARSPTRSTASRSRCTSPTTSLMGYGTGALMAVPAHDERDHEFARKFGIEIREVVSGGDDVQVEPYVGDGPLVNSGRFDGIDNREAYGEIVAWLEAEVKGKPAVNYRLRDWLLSRQRYWGCPIPIVYCEKDGMVEVPDDQLPVELPEVEDYAPKGKSPLAAVTEWVDTECPKCGGPATPRDRHDGHLRRLLLVLPALPRPSRRGAPVRARAGRLLDGGRQLHRRGRARDPPPDVRALLHEGARGHGDARRRGAVREPLHPRDDHDGWGEDVLVEGQYGERDRDGRPLRRRHRARLRVLPRPARPRRRLGPGGRRGRPPLPDPPVAPGERGLVEDRAGSGERRATRRPARPTTCWRRPTGRSTRSAGTSRPSSSTPRSRP